MPWFLINKLLGSTSFNPALLKIYDGAVVPLARGVEAIVSPPLGKNLIAIARKHDRALLAMPGQRSHSNRR